MTDAVANARKQAESQLGTLDNALRQRVERRMQDGAANDNAKPRHGDWMQTFSGRQFWPMDPRADEVFIEDIAHALSMQCRYAGHCKHFYSVAEHSVHLAQYFLRRSAPVDMCLWALLHDASEAYLVDVPRPVKPFLAGYKDAEKRVQASICEAFGLSAEMPAVVHEADSRIIANERANMAPCVAPWFGYDEPLTILPLDGIKLKFWFHDVAEIWFLDTFKRLTTEKVRVAA